jgi:ABC-type sugar transport system permease subunit
MSLTYKPRLSKKNNLEAYLFLLPLLVLFIGLLGYCFYFLLTNSFQKLTISFRNAKFVGFDNYLILFKDHIFWRALLNTFFISAANIFCGLTLGFFIAVILNFKIPGKRFFHSLFFIPSMLPIALMAAVFSSMMEYRNGTINGVLRSLNLELLAQQWLADPRLAMFSVCTVSIFLIGIPVMYYTADITTINTSVLEAATIDGANTRQRILLVLYPMLSRTHQTIILSLLLGGFREMERVFLMTDGGPGDITQIIGTYIFRSSRSADSNIGFVCAAAVVVLLFAFCIAFIQMKLIQQKD